MWLAALLASGAVGGMTLVDAQGRGGRAGGPGGPAARRREGVVEQIVVHGKALEGNLEGDSPDREATVYLPPSYAASPARRYPVLYLLHGYGGRQDTFTTRLASLAESQDRLAAAQGFSEFIVVTPSAYTLHKGSMYSNSPTTGDWERFVADDLVAYMDSHYRTLATRMSRGLAGHSMGGYGALRIGMKRPDVFLALYLMSSCCLTRQPQPAARGHGGAEAITTREQAEAAASAPGLRAVDQPRVGGRVVAEPVEPAALLDLPVKDGKVRPDVVAKWVANAPLEMVGQHVRRAEPLLRDRRRHRAAGRACWRRTSSCTRRSPACTCRTASRSTKATTPTRCGSGSSATCCPSSRRTSRRRSTRRRRRRSRRQLTFPSLDARVNAGRAVGVNSVA